MKQPSSPRGPDDTSSGLSRRSFLRMGTTAAIAAIAMCGKQKSTVGTIKNERQSAFAELEDNSELIEHELTIVSDTTGEIRTRITRIGEELALVLGHVIYRVFNTSFGRNASTFISSISYQKAQDELQLHAENLPPFGMAGDAFVTREDFEMMLRRLANLRPEATIEVIRSRYKIGTMIHGEYLCKLDLEQERGEDLVSNS